MLGIAGTGEGGIWSHPFSFPNLGMSKLIVADFCNLV